MTQELYELPEGWEWKKLASLVEIKGGATPSKANTEYWGGDIKWASVRDMQNDWIKDTELHITSSGFESCSTNLIPANNIILVTRVGLGKVAVTKSEIAINQDLRGLLVGSDVQLYFLFYWLKSNSAFIESSGTGATVKGVKLDFVKNLQCPIPSMQEQARIVKKLEALLSRIDQAIATLKQSLELIDALFSSSLNQAFNPLDAPLQEDGTYQLPDGWKWKGMEKVSKVGAERGFNPELDANGNAVFVSMADIDQETGLNSTFEKREYSKVRTGYTKFQKNAVLLAKITPCTENNKTALMQHEGGGYATTEVYSIHPLECILPKYLLYFLRSANPRQILVKKMEGATGRQRVPTQAIKDLMVPVCNSHTQEKVIQLVESMQTKTQASKAALTAKLEQLEQLKASLLDAAFRGNL